MCIFTFTIQQNTLAKVDLSAIPSGTVISRFKAPSDDDLIEFWTTVADSTLENNYKNYTLGTKTTSKGIDGKMYIIYRLDCITFLDTDSELKNFAYTYNQVFGTIAVSKSLESTDTLDISSKLRIDNLDSTKTAFNPGNPIQTFNFITYEIYEEDETTNAPLIFDCDYYIEGGDYEQIKKEVLDEISTNDNTHSTIGKEWNGNDYEFSKVQYDLPNFKVTEYKKNSHDYTFKWNNKEVIDKSYYDVLNVDAQIQGCFKMAFKNDSLLKPYVLKPIELPFEPLREVAAKNCFMTFDYSDIPYCPENDINYQSIFDKMVSLGIAEEDELYRYNSLHHNDTHNKVLNPNILLRYHYTDSEKGVEHYSKKYTYLIIHDDDIEVYEVEPSDIVTDDKGNTDIDATKKENILENNLIDTVDKSDDVNSNPGLFSKIKSFFKDIGSFPKYFSRIFSFLPEWCLVYVAFGVSIIVGVGVLKAMF